MSKWFLQFEGQVKGPYTNENLELALHNLGEQNLERTLVWKRGLTEWLKATKWRVDMVLQPSAAEAGTETRTRSASEKTQTQTQATADQTIYRVQLNFVDQPMMTRSELLAFISKQKDISKVSIQNPKTKEWNEVYAFPDIVERLGISRRKHPRVPILANFTGHSNRNEAVSVKVVTISEGGMGFTEVFNLKIGDQVEGQIMSPHFFQPIHLKAEVIYAGLDGYIGLKFSEINDEAKAAVIDYIKKFGKASTPT